jgi:type II secretory pathway component PulM
VKLEERDKKTLIIGGIAAAVILLYALVIAPLSADLSRKRDLIPKKERDLAEIRVLKDQYLEMQRQLQQVQAAAAQRGPILTEIENITRRANLSSKIVSLKPQAGVQAGTFQESIVEIKLENVTLYDIVNYVNLLEKATLRIRKLYFKPRFDNPKLLNSTILVSSAG